MSDTLSEAHWKAFTRKQQLELDDKDLLKALARLDKTVEQKPEPRLDALKDLLKEIPKQVVALARQKKELGDKLFGLSKSQFDTMLEDAEALQKKTRAALEASEEDEDEDEDSAATALVNPKLLHKQLTLCRKDPDRRMKFAFVDAKDKQPAMLAMHPRMSSRTLFRKLQAASGVKTGAYGTAWVDGMSLMLQLDKPLGGLVKKVRGPVRDSGFRIAKAVLWNEDGSVFEQDEAADEAQEQTQSAPATPKPEAAQATQATAPPSQDKPSAPPQPSDTYDAKLATLMHRVKRAADEGSPDAPKHKLLLDFAAGKAKDRDYMAALVALQRLEEALDKPTPKSESPNVEAGAAFKARLGALVPKLKDARAAGRPGALEATAQATEAGMLASKHDFDRAHKLLDAVEAGLLADARLQASAAPPRADGDASAAFKATLAEWTPAIKTAMTARGPDAAAMAKLYAQATALSKPGGDLEEALAKLTECHELALAANASLAANESPQGTDPVARWAAERSKVAAQLQAEIRDVVATGDAQAGNAELELRAVLRQINGELLTQRQATEMDRYLRDDDVVADISELAFDLKTPLLKVLSEIAPLLPA